MTDATHGSCYRLGEVCDRTGLSARRIREYERLGLVEGVERSIGGQRVYTSEQLQTLHTIVRLRGARLPLADIRLTMRVLNGRVLGVEADGVRRIRSLLGLLRTEVGVIDEIAQALERRLSAPRSPGDPGRAGNDVELAG